MALIENLQKIVPWLSGLPFFSKSIVSLVIILITVLLLAVLWSAPSIAQQESVEPVTVILKTCYRRSIYTRTHAQMSLEAMFASIRDCREAVQAEVPKIRSADWSQHAANVLGGLDAIEREADRKPLDLDRINVFKLNVIHELSALSRAIKYPFTLPHNLGETTYFTKEEADQPPVPTTGVKTMAVPPATGS